MFGLFNPLPEGRTQWMSVKDAYWLISLQDKLAQELQKREKISLLSIKPYHYAPAQSRSGILCSCLFTPKHACHEWNKWTCVHLCGHGHVGLRGKRGRAHFCLQRGETRAKMCVKIMSAFHSIRQCINVNRLITSDAVFTSTNASKVSII